MFEARENPNRWLTAIKHTELKARPVRTISLDHGARKQEKLRPQEKCFFLTSPFIELPGQKRANDAVCDMAARLR
jgi:hypothetical protein